jgi:16S rRNA U516 pseudouridylate synthase RsuA-like enzyme
VILLGQVRTLAEKAGLEITGLKRVRVGGYRLPGDLAVGHFREMRPFSVKLVIDKGAELNPFANPVAGLEGLVI